MGAAVGGVVRGARGRGHGVGADGVAAVAAGHGGAHGGARRAAAWHAGDRGLGDLLGAPGGVDPGDRGVRGGGGRIARVGARGAFFRIDRRLGSGSDGRADLPVECAFLCGVPRGGVADAAG